jgi:hypothetical protein
VTPAVVAVGVLVFDLGLGAALSVAGLVLLATHDWAQSAIVRGFGAIDQAAVESASRVVEFAQRQPVLRAFGRTGESNRSLDDALLGQRRAYGEMNRNAVTAGNTASKASHAVRSCESRPMTRELRCWIDPRPRTVMKFSAASDSATQTRPRSSKADLTEIACS